MKERTVKNKEMMKNRKKIVFWRKRSPTIATYGTIKKKDDEARKANQGFNETYKNKWTVKKE